MKWTKSVMICTLTLSAFIAHAQNSVGIGVATPNKNSVLELVSPGNNQGLLIPKLTTPQRTSPNFISALTTKENGLMVFDSDESKFYYWEATQWKALGTGSELSGGDGISIINNTVSSIPQDLSLSGSTLTITNNPTATPVNLSAFTGTNTDDQTLTYNALTGALAISRLTGGPQNVTISPTGAAGGDLAGTFPNPTIAAGGITSAKILDATIQGIDIAAGTISNTNIATGVAVNKLTGGTNGQILTTVGTTPIWTNPAASVTSIIAGTGLTGGTITTTGTIGLTNTGVAAASYGSGTLVPVLTVDLQGRITAAATTAITVAPSGAAGGELAGTYPNPTIGNDVITSAKIINNTIVNADINTAAAIAVSKLGAGTNGQVLTTSGGVAAWGSAGGSPLINNAGVNNLFAGATAGGTGQDNAFFGEYAGNGNTNGSYNVAVGTFAGYDINGGGLNTLVGWLAGSTAANASFNGNTFIGAEAGRNSTGGPNTFIGEKAGVTNTTGTENVFIGNAAGIVNTTGGRNTLVGYNSNLSANNWQNAMALGYGAVVDANNKVRIGNTDVTMIQGQVGFTAASDRRLKTDIESIKNGLDLVMKLKPVSYRMKSSSDQRLNWGFIAQDIESLVGSDNAIVSVGADKDRTLGLRYSDLISPLVGAVQQQQEEISALNEKLKNNEQRIASLESQVKELQANGDKVELMMAELERIKKAVGLKADIRK